MTHVYVFVQHPRMWNRAQIDAYPVIQLANTQSFLRKQDCVPDQGLISASVAVQPV